jgi:hypothetical protein
MFRYLPFSLRILRVLGSTAEKDSSQGSVHPAYNPYFLACFFNQNSVFLSQQINQQYFLVGLSAQPNGP